MTDHVVREFGERDIPQSKALSELVTMASTTEKEVSPKERRPEQQPGKPLNHFVVNKATNSTYIRTVRYTILDIRYDI